MSSSDPNSRQVGGEHYRTEGGQHWDFVELNGLGYLEGCATKYVARAGKKRGESRRRALEKAVHYVEKLLAVRRGWERSAPKFKNRVTVEDFCRQYRLSQQEEEIINTICKWRSTYDLDRALAGLQQLLQSCPADPE